MPGSRRAGSRRGRPGAGAFDRAPAHDEANENGPEGSAGSDRTKKPRGTPKDRALLLLAVRWRSSEELRSRLTRAGFEPADVESALTDLESAGLIDDQRFAREVVRSQAGRRLAGDRAIRSALRAKGVALAEVDAALEGAGDEETRALQLARQRAPRMAGLPPDAAFRRLYGLLLRRGYPGRVAAEACREALGDPADPPVEE